MRIRFKTFVVWQLTAFFLGMVAMLYILSAPSSQKAAIEQTVTKGCNTVIESGMKLFEYARKR